MKLLYALLFLLFSTTVQAQKIIYAKAGSPTVAFEVVGNVGGNYLVFETDQGKRKLVVYDSEMKKLAERNYAFLNSPVNQRAIINYGSHFFIIYEETAKHKIYCKALRVDSVGDKSNEPIILDTADLPPLSGRAVFNVTYSENKKTILIGKPVKHNGQQMEHFKFFNPSFHVTGTYQELRSSEGKREEYSSTLVSNNGTFITTKAYTSNIDNDIVKMELMIRSLKDSLPAVVDIPLKNRLLKDVSVLIDNVKDYYYVTSLFKEPDGHVRGLFTADIDGKNVEKIRVVFNFFSEALRGTVNPGVQPLIAFNELKIHSIDRKLNGAYTVTMEDQTSQVYKRQNHSTTRHDPFAPPREAYHPAARDYDFVRHEPIMQARSTGQALLSRNVYRSIVVVEIDSALNLTWNSIINKNQIDERFSSFGSYKSGVEKLYLFSSYQAPALVNHYGILPDGEFKKYNTFKTLQSGHSLMLRHLRQVGPTHVLVPTQYRNRRSLALIDFSKPYGSSEK